MVNASAPAAPDAKAATMSPGATASRDAISGDAGLTCSNTPRITANTIVVAISARAVSTRDNCTASLMSSYNSSRPIRAVLLLHQHLNQVPCP
jgi:hypothetical protein